MKRSFRAVVAALLLATPLLANCADGGDLSAPAQQTTIQRQDGLLGDVVDGVVGTVTGLLANVVGLVFGADANGPEAQAWIGTNGGTVSTAAYTLIVPKGAVKENTLFTMTPTNTGSYSLELKAYKKGLLGNVDVSSLGFLKPVTIRMSYAKATNVTDARKLGIVWVRENGIIEDQRSTVDTSAKTVSSALSHFSKYAMAQD